MPETELRRGWKLTNVDGTTHNGYRWPLPMPGETATVEATSIDHSNKGACPAREGDGLCVVREGIIRHVTSGGQRIGSGIGLDLRWDAADELGHEDNEKIRVAKVEVVGLFDPVQAVTWAAAAGHNLRNADLRYASLSNAELRYADLRNANLCYASLRNADLCSASLSNAELCYASLRNAELRYADLHSANLYNADLRNANLYNADLRSAEYTQRTVWPDGFDPAAAGARKVD